LGRIDQKFDRAEFFAKGRDRRVDIARHIAELEKSAEKNPHSSLLGPHRRSIASGWIGIVSGAGKDRTDAGRR
jgi:hypothetical protein